MAQQAPWHYEAGLGHKPTLNSDTFGIIRDEHHLKQTELGSAPSAV